MENLYSDNAYDTEPTSVGYAEILSMVEKIEKKLNKARKKRKNGKKGGKKKLKNRLEVLEIEHEQLKYFLRSLAMYQNSGQEKQPAWWQKALTTSLPKALDLASVVLRNRSQQIPLYLPDSRDRK